MERSGRVKLDECKHEREIDITNFDDLVVRGQYVYLCADCGHRRTERREESPTPSPA